MQSHPISPLSNLQRIQAAELNGSAKETQCWTRISQHQRSHTREIARKLETVNGEINANTTHIVPPERT
ncbi:hypothetical protein BSR59_25305 [Vibrio parahaemolyticus]|nr:hypothetical protein BSR59_25305 [Vibrio parahaemolyticus]OOQ72268.1 hypothetical protein BSR63_24180 [Vibrio parahaemolyticus]QEL40082.1 hypothetical protein BSR23_008185 [Vibrio parahaemolyticus]